MSVVWVAVVGEVLGQVDRLAKEGFKKQGVTLVEGTREVENQPQKRERAEEEPRKVKKRSSAGEG